MLFRSRASRVLTAEAVVGFTFAALLLLFPDRLLELYGISTGSGPVALARLIGAELLGLNVASVVALRGDRRSLVPVVRGHLVNDAVAALVAFTAVVGGVGNGFVWSLVAVYGVFALAHVWVLLARPRRFG